MTELDDMLRQSFARVAEPGDPAGVVDAIRARMAAGDTGTPAATSGFQPSTDRFMPWLLGGALLVVGGVTIGLTMALASTPVPTPPEALVTEQSVATTSPTPEATQRPTSSPTPSATPVPTEAAPPPAPAPVADTVGPTLAGASGSPDEVLAADSDADYCDIISAMSVTAEDNVGVVGVLISWTGVESGSSQMASGPSWTFAFNPADSTPTGNVIFTMVARDAAGNTSAPATATVKVWGAGNCLI